MLQKKCVGCFSEFLPKKKTSSFCSRRCAARMQAASRTVTIYTLTCAWCGKAFQSERKNRKRFCNTSCSARWRMSRPDFVMSLNTEKRSESSRKSMGKLRQRSDVQEKLRQHLSSDTNPFRKPETRVKAQIALREKGYAMLNGGNGKPIPLPQKMLALRLGWATEYVIATGQGWLPNHYKIDIAEPTLKIAVEIDGESHHAVRVRAADQRKDQWFKENGWKAIRFTNQEVMTDLERVARAVLSLI